MLSWVLLSGVILIYVNQADGPTLQETGVFPSFLLKSRRESNVSWLVADVPMTCGK